MTQRIRLRQLDAADVDYRSFREEYLQASRQIKDLLANYLSLSKDITVGGEKIVGSYTLIAGENITISADPVNNTVTISSTGEDSGPVWGSF